jgi:hypothetical protein
MEQTADGLAVFAKTVLYWVGFPPLLSQNVIPFNP